MGHRSDGQLRDILNAPDQVNPGRERAIRRPGWSAPVPAAKTAAARELLVIHRIGACPARGQMENVAELTRQHWKGTWDGEGQFHSYDGQIPILATTLELLREHSRAGPAFWRFGRDHRQSLVYAIGNPCMETAIARWRRRGQARVAATGLRSSAVPNSARPGERRDVLHVPSAEQSSPMTAGRRPRGTPRQGQVATHAVRTMRRPGV